MNARSAVRPKTKEVKHWKSTSAKQQNWITNPNNGRKPGVKSLALKMRYAVLGLTILRVPDDIIRMQRERAKAINQRASENYRRSHQQPQAI
uniref:hypothetical protein n=1 Tax=Salmonella sp. TaxID=599 RepID=UPI001CD990BF|nr:hypothetical protein [Salmonella sp.]